MTIVVLVALASTLQAGTPTPAAFEKEHGEIDRLLSQRKYLSAASYIEQRPELSRLPRFLRQLSHILVTDYAMTINFRMFALKDLKEGEDIERVRGTPGQYTLIGGDLERRLYDALAAHREDPDIQFAVGEYLSLGKACGCARPELFEGESANEFPYLERAHRAGIRDSWSLFRMGVHHLSGTRPDLPRAVELFETSLKEKPDNVAAHYNAAIAYLLLEDFASAEKHSAAALGKYEDAMLDADTFNVHGKVEQALGKESAAEKSFERALALNPAHEGAFVALLSLLRSQKRFDDYGSRAAAFVALDYANTYPFGVYLDSVARAGFADADRLLGQRLAARSYAGPKEVGAVFYGLGRLAELGEDLPLAHQQYRKSLDALRKQEKPPAGSIEALTALVERTRPR